MRLDGCVIGHKAILRRTARSCLRRASWSLKSIPIAARTTHRSPLGPRALRKPPIRPNEVARVAIGVFLEIVLMLGLGLPEGARRGDFGYGLTRPKAGRVDVRDRILGDALLLVRRVEDCGAVTG